MRARARVPWSVITRGTDAESLEISIGRGRDVDRFDHAPTTSRLGAFLRSRIAVAKSAGFVSFFTTSFVSASVIVSSVRCGDARDCDVTSPGAGR